MREFIENVLTTLRRSDAPEGYWSDMKMEWFRRYANGRISSTKHGADFFEVVLRALDSGVYGYSGNDFDHNFALILKDHGVRVFKESA